LLIKKNASALVVSESEKGNHLAEHISSFLCNSRSSTECRSTRV